MSSAAAPSSLLGSFWAVVVDVVVSWFVSISRWWRRAPPKQILQGALGEANYYEEWEAIAFQLDELLGNDLWRQNAWSKHYDYRLIYERLQAIIDAREEDDILGLVNLLRSGLVRNLGNITAPRLYNRAYAGTKLLIENYITEVSLAIEHVSTYPTSSSSSYPPGLTSQAKLDLLHDTRQAFGRTALVLQGGAIFGLCHIGVVKALHLRGLLPRIIVGTATGALIAALVGSHTEDELLDLLTGKGIDLTAFAPQPKKSTSDDAKSSNFIETIRRRVQRFLKDGYFLDVKVLEDCVRANVGDLTFEEAYLRTKRVLNITIPTAGASAGVPNVLNYLTAPNVLVWSAALASNTSAVPLYSPVTILCKDPSDQHIYPWITHRQPASGPGASSSTIPNESPQSKSDSSLHDTPLARIRELFNVNHFLVSQARPYIAPFLQTGDILSYALPRHATARNRGYFYLPLLRVIALECRHRLRQLDSMGFLPRSIRRFLVDDTVPGSSMTLVPELHARDFVRLLDRPTPSAVEEWILRGERSVWPAIGALKVRCVVEVELDRAYQVVRRRKPMDADAPSPASAAAISQTADARTPTDAPSGLMMKPLNTSPKQAPTSGADIRLRGDGEKRTRVHRENAAASGTSAK